MSHTFTFHFSKSANGTPRVMMIVDIEACCGTCRYVEIQRFYHGTPFHPLTLPKFKRLVSEAPEMLSYDCSNCGDPVKPEHVSRTSLTYGFADGLGIIQAFLPRDQEASYSLSPDARFDPQALPLWEPDNEGAALSSAHELSDTLIFERFERVFNPKASWRTLWDDLQSNDFGDLVSERVSPSCELVMARDNDTMSRWLDTHADEHLRACPLQRPPSLPTISENQPVPGAFDVWLQPEAAHAIVSQEVIAIALIDQRAVIERIKKTCRDAKLKFKLTARDDRDVAFDDITSPRESLFRAPVLTSDVLNRAAHTGITPGEAARLTTEEVIAEMMGIYV